VLGHSDNYIRADALVTPTHIVPEWYDWEIYRKFLGVVCLIFILNTNRNILLKVKILATQILYFFTQLFMTLDNTIILLILDYCCSVESLFKKCLVLTTCIKWTDFSLLKFILENIVKRIFFYSNMINKLKYGVQICSTHIHFYSMNKKLY